MPPSAAITTPGQVLRALTARTTIGQHLTSTIQGLRDIHLAGLSQVRTPATVGVPAGAPGSVDGPAPRVAWVASAWAVG